MFDLTNIDMRYSNDLHAYQKAMLPMHRRNVESVSERKRTATIAMARCNSKITVLCRCGSIRSGID